MTKAGRRGMPIGKPFGGGLFGKSVRAALLGVTAYGTASAATLVSNTGYMGKPWGDTALWVDGVLPENAPGAVLDTGAGGPEVRTDGTNRVVGTISTTFGSMPAAGGMFKISHVNAGRSIAAGDAPQSMYGTSFALAQNSLTFDNGGAGAVIRIDDGALGASAAAGGDGTKRQPFRHFYDVPVTLADSLLIDLNFASIDSHGHFSSGTQLGPIWLVAFAGKVSGDAGRNLTVDATAPSAAVAFLNDANDFAGDVEVKGGILRAHDTCDLPRVGTPFGRDNTITATNGLAGVDLGGFVTGEGQTLVLAGKRTLGSPANGVLYSSWAREDAFAAWRGGISLAGDAWFGGQIAGASWPDNFYPNDTPGDFAVTGPISDVVPSAVHIVNGQSTVSRTISFGGTNTFSGGLHLDNGLFNATCPEAFGAGDVVFNGGIYRYMRSTDANVFEAALVPGTGDFKVRVDPGVTAYASPTGFARMTGKNFYKSGSGTLVLTNFCHAGSGYVDITAGTVVFDLTGADYVKFGENANGWQCDNMRLYNDARLVATGDPAEARTAAIYFSELKAGSGCTFRAEKGQTLALMQPGGVTTPAYAVVETDGQSGSRVTLSTAVQNHAYVEGSAWLFYEGRSWCARGAGNAAVPVADAAYVTDWDAATATTLVDVTPALAADGAVPAGQAADCLRFNTPTSGGAELALTLGGDLTLGGNTILVTPAMGTTPVRITGGALKAATTLRIANFNTNATLTIESDIAGTGASLQIAVCGPGRTVLKGAKSFNHLVYVIGGTLGVDCADALGRANSGWNSGYVYLSNGGVIEATESFNPVADATTRGEFGLNVSETGGGLGAAEGKTLTLSVNGINPKIVKTGKGTLVFSSNAKPVALDVREGTVQTSTAITESPGEVLGRDGTTFVGVRWASPNQAGANGGGARCELQGKRTFRAEGTTTIDLNGGTALWSDVTESYDRLPNTEFFAGTGTIRLVDRSAAGTGQVSVNKYRDALFRGTMSAEVSVGGGGLKMPHATWCVPAGFTTFFEQQCAPRRDPAFARLTGEGTFRVTTTQSAEPGYFTLGEDGGADADFAGTLSLEMGGNTCSATQLLKIGDNAQRLSGTANRLEGNTIVRAGRLLVGADSPATAGASGSLGGAMVFVGDAGTPATAVPALLADGPYTVANEIRVHATSPAGALPTLGGTAQADGAAFTGRVTLFRDAAVHADAGATVSFTGDFVSNGHAVSKTGAGVVSLPGDVCVKRLAGGTLEAGGALTFADGATVDVSDFPAGAFDDRSKVYLLAEAAGGVADVRNVTITGLEERQRTFWKISVAGNRLSLRCDQGTLFLVR